MIITRYAGILNQRKAFPNYNLFTKSQRFDDAAWTKTGVTVTPNAIQDPFGGMNADKLVETATTGAHNIYQLHTVASGAFLTGVYVKAAERQYCTVHMTDFATGSVYGVINLNTGDLDETASAGSWTGKDVTIANAGNGWWKVNCVGTRGAGTVTGLEVFLTTSYAFNNNYLGVVDNGIYIFGAYLNSGTTDRGYQEVN